MSHWLNSQRTKEEGFYTVNEEDVGVRKKGSRMVEIVMKIAEQKVGLTFCRVE